MFKFNFEGSDEDKTEPNKNENEIKWHNSVEIIIPSNIEESIKKFSRDQVLKVDYGEGINFSCLSVKEVMAILKERSDNDQYLDVLKADCLHSDLLPGKYEGGLKVWECTKDLTVYFVKNEISKREKMTDTRILDLGCGSGILGIICLLHGANVTFQDYNKEVLEAMTIPNIFLNCDTSVRNRIKLYSGDWSSFLDLVLQSTGVENLTMEAHKYDYILTSETIYNPNNYYKIIDIFKKLLKPKGIAFVAAKTHYFGVGGNLREFENFIDKEGFNYSVCWETKEGISREILKVQNKNVLLSNN